MTDPTPGEAQAPESLSDVERRIPHRAAARVGPGRVLRAAASITPSTSGRASCSSTAPTIGPAPTSTARGARRPKSSARPRRWSTRDCRRSTPATSNRRASCLTSALEHGAPHEQALPVLHRIGLLASAAAGRADRRVGCAGGALPRRPRPRRLRPWLWLRRRGAAGDERGRAVDRRRRPVTRSWSSAPAVDPAASTSCRCLAPPRHIWRGPRRSSAPASCPTRWPCSIACRPATPRIRGPGAAGARAARAAADRGRRPDRPGRAEPAVKCPKCGYVGFEESPRCRHCGYDFSFVAAAEAATVGSGARRRSPPLSSTADEFFAAARRGDASASLDRLGFVDLRAIRRRSGRGRSSTCRWPNRRRRICSTTRRRRRGRRWRCAGRPIGRAAGRRRKWCRRPAISLLDVPVAPDVRRDRRRRRRARVGVARRAGRRRPARRRAAGGNRARGRLPHRAAVRADDGRHRLPAAGAAGGVPARPGRRLSRRVHRVRRSDPRQDGTRRARRRRRRGGAGRGRGTARA